MLSRDKQCTQELIVGQHNLPVEAIHRINGFPAPLAAKVSNDITSDIT